MISIGCQYGGPEFDGSKRIQQTLRAAMKALAFVRGPWVGSDDFGPCDDKPQSGPFFEKGSAPAVNVVFYIPGTLGIKVPDKIEAARFSRKHKELLVAVPAPPEMVDSEEAAGFVIDALHEANRIAAETFTRKGPEPFDLERAEALVEKVRQTLADQGF
jgi:hypothetical protein